MHIYHPIALKTYPACVSLDISYLLGNGNLLSVGSWGDVLSFRFIDRSMPERFKVIEWPEMALGEVNPENDVPITISAKDVDNEWKPIGLDFEYPYIEEVIPARMEEETCGIFRTGKFIFIKESIEKRPDYHQVACFIEEAVDKFKGISLRDQLGYNSDGTK